ncbi:hypothetical protein LCGC14_1632850 [marine sediment metagenome]|uniref:Uncharacterized protein n=1 Tax=marine sediment metagenome TaxID=412755 RepID=A0A0F9I241_9ZZZZ
MSNPKMTKEDRKLAQIMVVFGHDMLEALKAHGVDEKVAAAAVIDGIRPTLNRAGLEVEVLPEIREQ